MGCKIRLHPKPNQVEKFDLWRRRTRELWNLLLGLQRAAYSGEKHKPEIHWRSIWADCAKTNYDLAVARRKEKIAEGKEVKGEITPPDYGKILARRWVQGGPRLFIWEADLMKLMARLKKEPLTKWIGELHSHAAQAVCSDLVMALKAMLREKKKQNGRDVGFPAFKRNGYAVGGVYFANVQMKIGEGRRSIKFSNGVGHVPCGQIRYGAGSKLMGGRIWRQGRKWWLSAQFEIEAPALLSPNDLDVGIKVAARNIITVAHGRATYDVRMVPQDKRIERRLRMLGRKSSRQNRGTSKYYGTQERLAESYAFIRDRNNDFQHKLSRTIVNRYGTITMDTMDISDMVKRESKRNRKAPPKTKPLMGRLAKRVRKITLHAAMARLAKMIEYKGKLAGRTINRTHKLMPTTQLENLPNGGHEDIRTKSLRTRKHAAARNLREQGQRSKEASAQLEESGA